MDGHDPVDSCHPSAGGGSSRLWKPSIRGCTRGVARNRLNPMLPVRDLGEVRDAFTESNLPILVDIQDWARIPDSFRGEIERTGVVIFPGDVRMQP